MQGPDEVVRPGLSFAWTDRLLPALELLNAPLLACVSSPS
jgi:hypothetical protein